MAEYIATAPRAHDSAWVATDGKWYEVEYAGHNAFAEHMCERMGISYTYSAVDKLEQLGWVHVSGLRFVCPRNITDRQFDTLFRWYEAYVDAGDNYSGNKLKVWLEDKLR